MLCLSVIGGWPCECVCPFLIGLADYVYFPYICSTCLSIHRCPSNINNDTIISPPSPLFNCVFLIGEWGAPAVVMNTIFPPCLCRSLPPCQSSPLTQLGNDGMLVHFGQQCIMTSKVQQNLKNDSGQVLFLMEGEIHTEPELPPCECCTAPD